MPEKGLVGGVADLGHHDDRILAAQKHQQQCRLELARHGDRCLHEQAVTDTDSTRATGWLVADAWSALTARSVVPKHSICRRAARSAQPRIVVLVKRDCILEQQAHLNQQACGARSTAIVIVVRLIVVDRETG